MSIKAIETKYKGYRFRSRLEARWAVFFDALDLEWEYEKEGFDMDGIWYLPDFWLPRYSLWVEIKPIKANPSLDDIMKPVKLHKLTKTSILLLCGPPWPDEYFGIFVPESRNCHKLNKLARCRRCEMMYWVWETQDGNEFEGGPLGLFDCCHSERYPLEIPKTYYAKARGARFEHGETPE